MTFGLPSTLGPLATGLGSALDAGLKQISSRLDFSALLNQRGRMLQLKCALPDLALVPERMVLREAVSQPFELVLDCLSSSRHFELKQLIGEQMSVSLLQPDGHYAPWHGYVFEAAQLGADGGLARYRLTMRPWLAFLALRTDSFVYQDKTALEILQDLFADYPQAHFAFDVSEPLRTRSLCTQYNETDLAFVLRLLAEEGLAFHFRHLGGEALAQAQARTEAGGATEHALHQLVVTDRQAERPALGTLRFASQHTTANVAGQRDAITAFEARRRVGTNAVALGSWNYKQLAGTAAGVQSALALGELPMLESYDGAGAYRYESAEHAERAAGLALAALELDFKRFEGQGSVRHLSAGARFSLIDHPLYGANTTAFNYAGALLAAHQRPDNEFTVLAVEHHATNNLGSQAAELLGSTELERGTYKNHFHAAPAAAPVVPRHVRKPTAPGLHTALVVGAVQEPLTTDRDLRVKLQFPWQRGAAPLPGGLAHDDNSPDTTGNAPGNELSGTWVRVAMPSVGANWGSAFVPRVGTEVAVEYIEGDIDRPLVVGQLYNGADAPPFAAGVDSGVNHPGVISGLHSPGLDGQGYNQWVLDDSTGQLRMRLASSYASSQLNLGHLIQQGAGTAQRGAWRGAGFELGTAGWAIVRAAKGIFISTSGRAGSYGSAQGTQLDAAEAVAQLRGARALGQALDGAATASGAQGLASHAASQALERLIAATDPQQQGKHPGPVNGQVAVKTGPDGRSEGSAPVEAFDQPLVLLDTPSTAAFATEASLMALSGQDTSLTAQGDIHQAAAHTWASVSGNTTSLYTHAGGAKAYAANGPVSLRAHTDSLQIWADKDVTIVSVNDEIRISAKSRIEVVGGQSSMALEGGNVTFTCPGKFEVKSASHNFLGGGSKPATAPSLPIDLAKLKPQDMVLDYRHSDGSPVQGAPFEVTFADGSKRRGTLDAAGKAVLSSVPAGYAKVHYGEDMRKAKAGEDEKNPLAGWM